MKDQNTDVAKFSSKLFLRFAEFFQKQPYCKNKSIKIAEIFNQYGQKLENFWN